MIKLNEEDPIFFKIRERWEERARAVQTIEDFEALYRDLLEEVQHDYGTVIHATWALMLAAFFLVNHSPQGGFTGFQVSFLGWKGIDEFIRSTRLGARIIWMEDWLYPQMQARQQAYPTKSQAKKLQEEAKKNLESGTPMAPEVIAWQQQIAKGDFPFPLIED